MSGFENFGKREVDDDAQNGMRHMLARLRPAGGRSGLADRAGNAVLAIARRLALPGM